MQGGAAEAAGYSPSEETLQRFWEHCEDILARAAVEVPEASLDADTQAQRLEHAKLEQVLYATTPAAVQALTSVWHCAVINTAQGMFHSARLISHLSETVGRLQQLFYVWTD